VGNSNEGTILLAQITRHLPSIQTFFLSRLNFNFGYFGELLLMLWHGFLFLLVCELNRLLISSSLSFELVPRPSLSWTIVSALARFFCSSSVSFPTTVVANGSLSKSFRTQEGNIIGWKTWHRTLVQLPHWTPLASRSRHFHVVDSCCMVSSPQWLQREANLSCTPTGYHTPFQLECDVPPNLQICQDPVSQT
jgi:hypothetical protein